MERHVTLPCISFDHFIIDSANQARAQRNQSEDYVLVDPDVGLLGVFDVVGGRDNGRLISHLAGKTIASTWQSLSQAERQRSPAQLESTLQKLIRQADATIAEIIIPQELKRPATTVALGILSIQETEVYLSIAHIGDSRIYLLRAGHPLQRLTEDNGYFPFAVRQGRMTREEGLRIEQARCISDLSPLERTHFARRNEITCVVGWTDFPCIQTHSLALIPGDRVVLCTDGVHDNLGNLAECSTQRQSTLNFRLVNLTKDWRMQDVSLASQQEFLCRCFSSGRSQNNPLQASSSRHFSSDQVHALLKPIRVSFSLCAKLTTRLRQSFVKFTKIRSLGLILSNIQPNYHIDLGKPSQIWGISREKCK